MTALINLRLTLPDGEVGTYRQYPTPPGLEGPEQRPAREADARDWLASELPGAIKQLCTRAGLEPPGEEVRHLMTLLDGGIEHTPEGLRAVVGTFGSLRDIVHEIACELGVDLGTRQVDSRTGLLAGAANLPRLAAQKVGDLGRARRNQDRLAAKMAELAAAYPVTKHLSGGEDPPLAVVDAALEALADRAREIDERGRVIDAVKDALGLTGEARDSLADADLDAAVSVAIARPEGNPDGKVVTALLATYGLSQQLSQAEVLGALQQARRDENAKAVCEAIDDTKKVIFTDLLSRFDLPLDADDPIAAVDEQFLQYKNIGDEALGKEYRRGQLAVLEALDVDASALPADADLAEWAARARATWHEEDTAGLRAELDVYRDYLATMLADLDVGKPKRHEDVRTGALHPDDLATLTTAAQTAIESLNDSRRAELRMGRELARLLSFFKLPATTPVERLSERVIETAKKAVEAEVELLRAAVTASGELTHAFTAVEAAMIRNGVDIEKLKAMLHRARTADLGRVEELAVLRHLAAEVAQVAGASAENQARYSNGELAARHLASELHDVVVNLRKDLRSAELDATRRILSDIATTLGNADLRETLIPGAVADLVHAAEASEGLVKEIRAVVSALRGGAGCDDDQLPGRIRQLVLSERLPSGSMAHLSDGSLALILDVDADGGLEAPIRARRENGGPVWLMPGEIQGVEAIEPGTFFTRARPGVRPGDFYTGDGRKARAFHLPEDGLADILKNAPWAEQSLARAKVEEAANALADKIERVGEGLAEKLGRFSDRVVTEINEAIEKARKDGER